MSELKAGICISRMSAYAPHVKCVVVQLYILLGAVWGPAVDTSGGVVVGSLSSGSNETGPPRGLIGRIGRRPEC